MDYHAAETLDVAFRHLAPAPIETALPMLRAMADAIDAAWAAGPACGHGTLHPRDVFVTPGTDELRITGFGVAPALEAIGARPPVRRPYTAPERAAGETWDARADTYSLGAIAHELLTGRRPAGPGEQDGTLPASMAPEERVHIRRVLSKALAESPAQRFATAREFVDALADPSKMPEMDAVLPVIAEPDATAFLAPDLAPESQPEPERWPDADPPVAVAPPVPPAAPRVQRARAIPPAPKVPARVPAKPHELTAEDIAPIASAPMSDLLLKRDDLLPSAPNTRDRVVMSPAPLALPPPFPWVALAAAFGAGLVIGAVAMVTYVGYRSRVPVSAPPAAPAAAAAPANRDTPATLPPAPAAPAASDTEVRLTPPPADVAGTDAPRKTPAAPVKPTPAPGRLLVRSTPTGASVTIDGKPAGRSPFTARDLTLASHTVVVSRPGFVSESRRVTLTGRAPSATLTFTLKAERPATSLRGATTGSVTVDSRPRGAQVTIDGRALGVTPLSVPGLSAGVHTVRVELAGHKPVTTTVTVKAGETARVALTLEVR